VDIRAGRPNTVGIFVDVAYAAPSKPPTANSACGAVSKPIVVVVVWSAEHLSVGIKVKPGRCNHHGVAGVAAVPGHRQLVLTNLITDGERRIFS